MKTLASLSIAVAIAALSSTASATVGGPNCLPEFAGQPANHAALPGYRAPVFRPGYRPYGYAGLPWGGPGYAPGGFSPMAAPVMPMMPAPTMGGMPGMGTFPGGVSPWGGAPFNGPFGGGPFGGGPFGSGPFGSGPFGNTGSWDPMGWGGAPWGTSFPGYAPIAPIAPAVSTIDDDQLIIDDTSPTPPAPVDTDQDGVFDSADLCADTVPTAKVDGLGCSLDAHIVLEGVNFHTDSAKLTDASITILDGVAKTLTSNPDVKVEVAGHTDSDAAADYNLKLSHKRAQAVVAYLTTQGVQADHMAAKGYGETQPMVANDSAANKATNRRVELRRL